MRAAVEANVEQLIDRCSQPFRPRVRQRGGGATGDATSRRALTRNYSIFGDCAGSSVVGSPCALRTEELEWDHRNAVSTPVGLGPGVQHNGVEEVIAELALQPMQMLHVSVADARGQLHLER